MKYLKKFNEGISNEYYEPVDSSMFDDRTQIVFTDDEIYRIEGILKEKATGIRFSYTSPNHEDLSNIGVRTDGGSLLCNIEKYEDEWYFVYRGLFQLKGSVGKTHFACDQFEGLIKLLNDFEYYNNVNLLYNPFQYLVR